MADKPWKKAIENVLKDSGEPMSRTEIADAIVALGLREKVGATPANTVSAQISLSIANEGESSPFVRVGRGQYALRADVGTQKEDRRRHEPADEEQSEAGGVQAFGVYWSRNLVHWTRTPKLLGQQQLGAEPVDMAGQIGVYLLYDHREVVYVGRAIERPIGQRLYEHTQDRLRGRWNRFSWYGIYPVTERGDLLKQAGPTDAGSLIRALEAVLIEAMEPRQNRKRGDDFSAIEYIQTEDPKIEKTRKQQLLHDLAKTIE